MKEDKVKITIEVDKKYYEIAKKVADVVGVPLDAIINAKIHEIAFSRNVSFYFPSSIPVQTAKELGIEEEARVLDERFKANEVRYKARLDNADVPDVYGEY